MDYWKKTVAPQDISQFGLKIIKLFAVIIYCHSTVLPSLGVLTQYYANNYCGIEVNYIGQGVKTITIYHGILILEIFGLELAQ
jgi:hypothetical protein